MPEVGFFFLTKFFVKCKSYKVVSQCQINKLNQLNLKNSAKGNNAEYLVRLCILTSLLHKYTIY